MYASVTDLTLVTLYHPPTLMHTHSIRPTLSVLKSICYTWPHSLATAGGRHVCDTATEAHAVSRVWLMGCVTPTPCGSFSGPRRAAFVRGDLEREEAEYSIECRRQAIDCSLRMEGIYNRTALLIRAPEGPIMTKSREAAQFISAFCMSASTQEQTLQWYTCKWVLYNESTNWY